MTPRLKTPQMSIAAAALALTVSNGTSALAQDRMPPIPADRMTDEQRQAVSDFRAERGADLSGPFIPLLRSPEAMTRVRAMGDYFRYRSRLPPRLSEFVILMTSRSWSQQYEWSVHYPIALEAGLAPEIASAIADGRRPERMDEQQSILYDLCSELTRTQHVSDGTYQRAVSLFGEGGVIDTVGMVGYYTMLAMVLNTAQTPARETGAPILPRRRPGR